VTIHTDAALKYDASGYVTDQSVTVNADGPTMIVEIADNTDGGKAEQITSTI